MATDIRIIAFKIGMHEVKISRTIEKLLLFLTRIPTLFIFDNAKHNVLLDKIQSHIYELKDNIHVILTTRDEEIIGDDFSTIPVPPFTFEEAKTFITDQLWYLEIPLSDPDIEDLCKLVDYNPQYLAQSVLYIKEKNKSHGFFSMGNFIRAFSDNNLPFLSAEEIEDTEANKSVPESDAPGFLSSD